MACWSLSPPPCAILAAFSPGAASGCAAIRLEDYVIADGKADDAFVNVTVKMGAGRSAEFKREFFTALFEKIKAHFADLYARRYSGFVALCRGSRRERQLQAQQYPPALPARPLMPLSEDDSSPIWRRAWTGGTKPPADRPFFPRTPGHDDRGWLSRAARLGGEQAGRRAAPDWAQDRLDQPGDAALVQYRRTGLWRLAGRYAVCR